MLLLVCDWTISDPNTHGMLRSFSHVVSKRLVSGLRCLVLPGNNYCITEDMQPYLVGLKIKFSLKKK